MFKKEYQVKKEHIDFQGVVDGLYYPFYLEWARHAFMREVIEIDIEQDAKLGIFHMLLEYKIKFNKSMKAGDTVTVSCQVAKHEKKSRINFIQTISINHDVYCEAVFTATCLINGRPSIPEKMQLFITA